MSLQQSYGNQATGKMVHALHGKQASTEASKGVKTSYERLIKWLEREAIQEHQQVLWRQFEMLSPAQRQAVLLEMAGSMERLEALMDAPMNWERLLAGVTNVEGVRLEPDEPELEGTANESGAQAAVGTVDVTGLLTPYKDIVLWLNYKANKQGKAQLMRRFEMLSIPQKKIAIHKMMNRRKLLFADFTKTMSITILLKKWVDWGKMLSALNEAEKVKLDITDELSVEHYLDQEETELEQEEELALEEDGDFFASGLELLGRGEEKQANAEIDIKKMLDDHEQLNWLLFGIKAIPSVNSKEKSVSAVGTPELIVDRFLKLDVSLPPKAREEARKRQLKAYGYSSTRQCYVYLLTIMVSLIFERGVTKKEKAFIQLMEKLGLSAQKPTPTQEMIAHQLRSSQ
ncbi:hypothetical protein [Paenibacillus luteus]|uniref:hypothetical protein n=1 Tax=Paenibacillus luteus TaxID=2545753 RepID=UPI0011448C40|nr:hypothetical protein [Paenibacillus luteus]